MRAISVPSAPLGLQSSSAWTALTGAHVSWSMGFEQRIKRARAIGHEKLLLSAGLFDNALASLGEDGSAALSEDARRRRPVGMVTSDRRRGDARLFSCV